MFKEKIAKMVEAAPQFVRNYPEFLQRHIGIYDESEELYQMLLNRTLEVLRIISNDSEYISEINGIYILLNDRVHEFYVNQVYPGSGLGNHIPMAMCAGVGLVDIGDNLIIVNTKFCEMERNMQVFLLLHELGHILCGDALNELEADRYACQCMEEGVGKKQLEKIVRYVEDACKDNPQYHGYVESVKIRLNFV